MLAQPHPSHGGLAWHYHAEEKMRVTIRQPDVFPPMYVLNRYAQSDLVVILDTAQFARGAPHHRYVIRGDQKVTVPVKHGGRPTFAQAMISRHHGWERKQRRSIEQAYTSPNHRDNREAMERVFEVLEPPTVGPDTLLRMARRAAILLASYWPLPPFVLASTLKAGKPTGDPAGWMIDIALEVGAMGYIGPRIADSPHNDPERFSEAGIQYLEQDWRPSFNGLLAGFHGLLDPFRSPDWYWGYITTPTLSVPEVTM